MREKLRKIKMFILYCVGKVILFFKPINYDVMSIEQTIENIENNKAIIRFGDGEFMYLSGKDILYQKFDKKLAAKLAMCLEKPLNNTLICVPEALATRKNFVRRSKWHWTYMLARDYKYYKILNSKYKYGNAFISRPYIIYKDKRNSDAIFDSIKRIWEDKKVLIVEGEFSRTGVGNDLFNAAKLVKRLICPSQNAFEYFDKILFEIKKNYKKFDLILVILGPTAKPIVYELAKDDIISLDFGHIDSEYEWYKHGVLTRTLIPNKHTADRTDRDILPCDDQDYINSIIKRIGGEIS